MKRILAILALALASAIAGAQNNPYDIDDECFKYFSEAENLVNDISNDEFEKVNQKLLSTALAKNDQKARTLYYVGQLKRTSKKGQKAPRSEREKWNAEVEADRTELCAIAKETDYLQYYYYAYELAQTYYFNSGQNIAGTKLLNDMMEEAKAAEDEYGLWQCLRYISQLYQRENDLKTTQKYLKQVVDIHLSSNDPMVKRQSITRPCCDLADTYPVASDSARFYYRLGERMSDLHLDTLRINYYKAQLAAYDRDFKTYRSYRDYCLGDKSFNYLFRTGDVLFACVDKLIDGQLSLEKDKKQLDTLYYSQQKNYLASLAGRYYAWDVSSYMKGRLYDYLLGSISRINDQRLDEIAAQYGNYSLNAELAEKSKQVSKITALVAILLTVILFGALLFTWVHMRNLEKAKRKDEERIAELQEANEKVRLADAAKTRFVQNMSHEVRTPLNAIVGFSQLLSLPDGSFPEEEKEEFSGHIINNTKMLTMLLDDILNASSRDKGDYKISYEDGECGFMCHAAMSSAEHRLQSGVTMNYKPSFDGEFHFRTDPRRVQQILINLLTNACKHTKSGTITLGCSLKEYPGEVAFSVTDTGTGVPADQAEKIFERFTKLNEYVQGTGLGLSICRDIAERMGGRVFLDTSYKGSGARFLFVLPINPPEKQLTPNNL